ncbi:unnamed protein product [Linum trigynum]|uniref:Uncharacterized protein n=1 Tax=Linum trigynum TaxID=586398 RepID=A0AAV2DWL5_9ROSI
MMKKRSSSGADFGAAVKRARMEGQLAVRLGLSVAASEDYHQMMAAAEEVIKGFTFPQAEGFMHEIEHEARILEKVMDVGGESNIAAPEKLQDLARETEYFDGEPVLESVVGANLAVAAGIAIPLEPDDEKPVGAAGAGEALEENENFVVDAEEEQLKTWNLFISWTTVIKPMTGHAPAAGSDIAAERHHDGEQAENGFFRGDVGIV